MRLTIAPEAKEQLSKLPIHIQKKANRQLSYLLQNYHHPSLHAKKKSGSGVFEARIDIHYRFTFMVEQDEIYILTIGTHDTGLGKK